MFSHNLDPVLIDFGFMAIRWYSLAYIFGIIIGWWYGKKILNHISKNIALKFNVDLFDDLITFIIISLIVGGRLGYVIFIIQIIIFLIRLISLKFGKVECLFMERWLE